MSRRALVAALVLVVVVVPLAMLGASGVGSHIRGDGMRAGSEEVDGDAGRAGSEEVDDDDALTAERLEALAKAKANRTFGGKATTTNPTTGWVGSRLVNAPTDDWEPAVATDPSSPYVYLLTTRYGTNPPGCSSHCPSPFIAMTTSADGGSTWGEQRALCTCLGSHGQFDPTIEVVPTDGAVYSVFMNGDRHAGFSAVFTKSLDHGANWTAPVHVYGSVSWTDKPEVATSASGKDIYVSWNGPQGGDLYVGQSHDFGATWTQQKLSDSKRYYYAYDARVLADGTVVFSESSLLYAGAKNVDGEIWHHAVISRDNGATWEDHVVAKVSVGEMCVAEGCKPDFYVGQTSVVSDAPGHLVLALRRPDGRLWAATGVRGDVLGRRADMECRRRIVPRRRERDRAPARIVGRRQCPLVVHADRRRRQPGCVERLVQELVEWRPELVLARQARRRLGRRRQSRLHQRERVRRDLRRLRRGRGHEHRKDVCDLG